MPLLASDKQTASAQTQKLTHTENVALGVSLGATVTMVMRGAECARRCIAGGVVKRLNPNSKAMSILPWARYAFLGRQSWEAGLRPESQPARSKKAPRPLACANVRVH